MPEPLTLGNLRIARKDASSGCEAFGVLLTRHAHDKNKVDHSATIAVIVAVLEVLNEQRNMLDIVLERMENGFFFHGSAGIPKLAGFLQLMGDAGYNKNNPNAQMRGSKIGLRGDVVGPLHTVHIYHVANALQVFITTDSLVVGGRTLWERD